MGGYTEDNRQVIQGVFKYVETRGIPLEIIITVFDQQGLVIDWIDFYEQSQKCGWLIKTTINKIEAALLDTKGKEYTDIILDRLKFYIGQPKPKQDKGD